MPPILALILCIVFVLFLLRLDHKQTPKMSRALWIPTIWMLSIASKPLGVWFRTGGEMADPAEGSPLDRNFLIVLLFVGFLLLIIRRFNWYKAIKENTCLILLIVYMLVSILWSDILFISFKRWTKELLAVLMAFLVLTERNPRQAMESIFRRTIYILIPFSLLLVKYYPEYGVSFNQWSGESMWVGVTMQKNGLGRLCIIAAFFLIWTFIKRWQGHDTSAVRYQTYAEICVLIITVWLLNGPGIAAMSATAVIALAAGLSAFVGLLLMKKYKIYVGVNILLTIIATIIILGTITLYTGGSTVGTFTSTVGRDATLTGRTEVWAALLPVVMRRPILGGGFGGFWTNTTREMYEISEGHSGYLDVLLDLGFVGLLLVTMFLLSSCWKNQRILAYDYDWGSLCICCLLMAVVHNITETSLNTFSSHLMAVVLFLSVSSTSSIRYKPGFSRKT